MKILWSAKNNAFFYEFDLGHYARAGWDISDVIPVSEPVFKTFTNPPPRKIRVVGPDGLPTWEDVPPPTPEQLQQRAESQKSSLRQQADIAIAPLQDAVDLDMATDAEKSALTEWRKYRVLLNRVNCTTAPDIQWPEQPK
ncbi:tail fiber assembly protein [Xenorhabdus griffiniae]|uniref:Tail fiber assembly protein n=1 Tax=Xenorhabdus griffiniae TaxID=351672 RepID=A0ABY9XEF7_9GAMM|nr:tail fiber assembly protein [Xenorhabdus griffiniae]MBD1228400.1 tail fiber assembly protein [Xenorhabdus griffiniae]MBE8587947.1 tail fiber assembly protein [Xenorhabdus griffiniae]WMV71218.1 tail fiber assembly protein [Xenorhabdus griffiniae]WNH00894.1 tail fiber assembly protein [Xenorhabdus griffiniae]